MEKKEKEKEKQEFHELDIDEQMHEWVERQDEEYISRYEQCM